MGPHGTLGPWDRASWDPRDSGTLGHWDPGTLGPGLLGPQGHWDPGTLGPGLLGPGAPGGIVVRILAPGDSEGACLGHYTNGPRPYIKGIGYKV